MMAQSWTNTLVLRRCATALSEMASDHGTAKGGEEGSPKRKGKGEAEGSREERDQHAGHTEVVGKKSRPTSERADFLQGVERGRYAPPRILGNDCNFRSSWISLAADQYSSGAAVVQAPGPRGQQRAGAWRCVARRGAPWRVRTQSEERGKSCSQYFLAKHRSALIQRERRKEKQHMHVSRTEQKRGAEREGEGEGIAAPRRPRAAQSGGTRSDRRATARAGAPPPQRRGHPPLTPARPDAP